MKKALTKKWVFFLFFETKIDYFIKCYEHVINILYDPTNIHQNYSSLVAVLNYLPTHDKALLSFPLPILRSCDLVVEKIFRMNKII